jgi:gliding motility-associated-like protein
LGNGTTGMRGTLTKLLTVTSLLVSLFSQRAAGQCALITDNFSGQVAGSVCAPVNLNMDVRYKFMLPVNPSNVQILYVWNDGTGATTLVPAISQGDTIFTATATHMYPPADLCSYTAEAYVVYNGQQCVSSSRQEQTFSAWARDNQNGAVIITDPVVAQFCEGEDIIDVRFTDNSTFNCNINIEPDKPNRITRWVQFIYGTKTIGGDRIPNITIRDPLGNVFQMTDAAGNSLPPVSGPIVEIPIPADGPTEISWPISAPAGGIAGDIFEITLRNWNICNPYDRNPFDAIPPADLINGDNAPITTTALIEIITTPPVITNPSLEFCAGSPITLTLSTSGGQVNWYSDSLLTNHIYTGNSFNPTGAPTYIDNSVGGSYSFWVTESIGACASAPSRVSFRIFDTPAPTPNAGPDAVVCDNRYALNANVPVIGAGLWSTTSGAVIDDLSDPHTTVGNLNPGPNLFRWTISNGPCVSVDEVIITSDLQPAPALAGIDQSFCNNGSATLHANVPNNNGNGTWTVASGNASFNDIHNATATASSISGGENALVWTIKSQYGACLTTTDTMKILRDLTPDPANAGPDRGVCDSLAVNMAALQAGHGGMGSWTVILGGGIIDEVHSPASPVSNLSFGTNQFRWNVVSQYGICPGSSDNVIITRDQAPSPALAGMDQNLCSSVTAPLGANSATVGTGTWSIATNPTVTPPVFIPATGNPNATVQILPGNEGIYEFAWTIVNGSCRTSDTLMIDFGMPVPPADAGQADSVCGTSATINGNNPGIGTGTWRKIVGVGTVTYLPGVHSPSAIAQIDNGNAGYYTFEWRITSGSCPPSADTVGILFKPMPGNPSASDADRCGSGSVVLSSTPGTNGDINHWYDNATGGPLLVESNGYTTPVLSADADYWVSSYNFSTGCESYRRRVNVMIHPVPREPVVADMQHCGNASMVIPATVGNDGTTNRWYNAPLAGSLLAQADTFTTPLLSAPITYWVSSYNEINGCESNRVAIRIQIDPMPALPVASDTARCGEGAISINSTIGANGTSNRWYDAPIGGALLDTALKYVIPYLTSSTAYWVSTINQYTGCQSPRLRVMANIHPIPGYPSTTDVTQCGPDTLMLISTPGSNGTINRWYDSLTGGSLLLQGNDYLTNYLTFTHRYYVSSYNETTHCESSRKEVMAVVLPVPVANTILGPSAVGVNQTNVIYSVNYQPGYTYDWLIPPGMNLLLENQNFVIVEFPNIGNYNLSVVETNSIGCVGPPAIKPVEVKVDLIVLNINTTQEEVCVGNDLQLSVVPTGGTPSYTFDWGGDTQYLNSVNSSNPVFTSPVQGSFMLTIKVSDINGNHSSDTIRVTVFPNPFTQIIASDSLVCSGSDLPLNANVSGGSGVYNSYTWSGQTAPLSATDIRNPIFNTYLRGTYKLTFTVKDYNGCTARDSISILNDSPQSAYISNAQPGCSPVQVEFTNQSNNAVDFSWNFGDGKTSTLENPTHVFSNISNSVEYFNVILTAISANNCMHTTNGYITVYPNPVLNITTYPIEACAPADILLSSTPGGFSYFWEFGDGSNAAGDFNIMHTFDNNTDRDTAFTISLISTSFFGCEDTGYTTITVHPSPEASFSVDPVTQMIPDRTVSIINTTEAGNWNYQWRFGDDSTSMVRDPGSHTYPGPGDRMITLVVSGEHCSDSTWTSIEIVPHPPMAAFKPIEPGCMPLTIQFENTSSYSNSFLWEFGDGAVSNKPNPDYTYYQPGTYKIKLTAWGEGGTDTYSTVNDVWVLPNAYFEIAPRFVYVNDQAVHYFNLSDNGDVYLWDFGDGTGSGEMEPTHMYAKEGNYDVTLNVWTKNDCYDLYVLETAVLVEPTGRIVFPNVFRPESPIEENRTFKPGVIDHVEEYHLMLFNRWGELIFESFDKDTGWDGYVNGKMTKEDVYIWKVEGKYSGGQTFVKSGDVTLLH